MIESKINEDHLTFCLPSEFKYLDNYISENRETLLSHIVTSIKYAVENDLDFIDIFSFKDSNFSISIEFDEFATNIDHIYNIYIKEELYELCQEVVDLQKLLKHKYDNS